MLDIKYIIENESEVVANLEARGMRADVKGLVDTYHELKKATANLEFLNGRANKIAKEIPRISKLGTQRATLMQEGREVKVATTTKKAEVSQLSSAFKQHMLAIPNRLASDTPRGLDDKQNVPIRYFSEPTTFDFKPQDHLEIASKLDLLDFEGGAKVVGNKFYFLRNEAVLLDMALQQFALRKAMEKGFIPLITPDLAKNSVLEGVGFQPRGDESNTYTLEDQELSLIATAEIAVGGLHRDDVFSEKDLPLRYAAYSHCFRREAGAAGQSSKGLYRVHQFGKVELFAFATPEQSEDLLEEILEIEESIYQELEIPYRVVRICAGDLGAPAHKKYDIEAWMPGKGENGEYGEVTSASNCTDFQSRRLNVRYSDAANGTTDFVHTLNGTATALSRTLVALLENHQTAEGGVNIPKALVPYMGQDQIKRKLDLALSLSEPELL